MTIGEETMLLAEVILRRHGPMLGLLDVCTGCEQLMPVCCDGGYNDFGDHDGPLCPNCCPTSPKRFDDAGGN